MFGIGWAYFGGGATANFEGAFSADPATGVLDWVDGGRGDNYDVAVAGDVLYTVGHPHDWGMLDWNPQYRPVQFQHAMAIDKHRSPTLTNAFGTSSIWRRSTGRPAAQPLHWLPTLGHRHRTPVRTRPAGASSPTATTPCYGGEFPRVNGTNQQGLVRFAKRAISPTVDPIQGFPELTPTVTPLGPGTVRVGWTAAWDRDNATADGRGAPRRNDRELDRAQDVPDRHERGGTGRRWASSTPPRRRARARPTGSG